MTEKFGICESCGVSWELVPHNHQPIKVTLSPEEALDHWRNKKNAPESRRQYSHL